MVRLHCSWMLAVTAVLACIANVAAEAQLGDIVSSSQLSSGGMHASHSAVSMNRGDTRGNSPDQTSHASDAPQSSWSPPAHSAGAQPYVHVFIVAEGAIAEV